MKIKGYIPQKKQEQPNQDLASSMMGTVALFNDLKNTKQDIVSTVNNKINEIDSTVEELKKTHSDSVRKIDDKVQEFEQTAIGLIKDIHNIPTIKGQNGKNAEEVDTDKIAKDVLSKVIIPQVNEESIVKKVLTAIPKNPASLKVIRETFDTDPIALLEKISSLPEGQFKLKTSHIDGLDQTIQSFKTQIRNGTGYVHGGGDTVAAGTNITITTNSNGAKVINSTGGGGTPGGLNTQLQYNNNGAFGGISGATTNGTIVSLTNPLLGGATLTTSTVNGVILVNGGTSTLYLSQDGTYTTPAGTYVLPTASTTVLGGVKVDGTSITISGGVISATSSGGGTVTNVSSADANATVATQTTTPIITIVAAPKLTTARTIGTLTGDATSAGSSFDGTGNNTNALTLATVNTNTGSWGTATQSPQFTVNGKGLITAAANVTITPAIGSITGLGTGVATFLATPSSANLASAVTDETGSGALVFGTSPTVSGATLVGTTTFSDGGSNTLGVSWNGNNWSFVPSANAVLFSQISVSMEQQYLPGADQRWFNSGFTFSTVIGVTNPTANRTITFPDATGTVALSSNNLSFFSSTTSSQLAGIISDETGSGALVFATAPTITLASASTAITQAPSDNSTKIATTAYVAAALLGQDFKEACKYGTTTALPAIIYNNGTSGVGATLTAVSFGAITLDGSTPSVGDRILVKNQVSTFQNGIYVVTVVGAVATLFVLTRSADFNQSSEIDTGDTVFITSGSTLSTTTWAYNGIDQPTMGTDAITFAQTAGQGSFTAGNGIAITGTSIAIDTSVTVDKTTAQTLTNKTLTTPIINGLPTGTGIATANTVSTLVARDGSGNFSAGTITAALTGNATTATALATGRTIAITGDLTYTSPSFDGSGNVTATGTLATVNTNVGSFTNANITVNGKGLITAASSGTTGIAWTEVTGTTQTAAVNNGYICNNASLVIVTLPSTAALGSIIEVTGKGAGGWKIAQNASGIIHFGSIDTTTGTGGSLQFTQKYDSVRLVCTVANNEWVVLSSVGNITIV